MISTTASRRAVQARALRRWVSIVVVLLAALPVAMAPSWGVLLHALGGGMDHHCACGMVKGKCGCRECERLERQRDSGDMVILLPVLKGSCDDDGAHASTPRWLSVLPASASVSFVHAVDAVVLPNPLPDLISLARDGPPVPPPRLV